MLLIDIQCFIFLSNLHLLIAVTVPIHRLTHQEQPGGCGDMVDEGTGSDV